MGLRRTAHDYGFSLKGWVVQLLYRGIEGIQVSMQDITVLGISHNNIVAQRPPSGWGGAGTGHCYLCTQNGLTRILDATKSLVNCEKGNAVTDMLVLLVSNTEAEY